MAMSTDKIIDITSDDDSSEGAQSDIETEEVFDKHQLNDEIEPWGAWQSIIQSIQAEEDIIQEKDDAFAHNVFEHFKSVKGNIDDKIIKIWELMKVTQEQLNAMKEVSIALENALKVEFPECKAFPFGSSASRLGFRDCDLDIYIELGYNKNDEAFYEKSGMWGAKFRTRITCEILKKTLRFGKAISVLNARTPIIKLRDKLTGINCDINVVSCMGVKNTEYLAFCSDQEDRFAPLVCVIKCFCREQGITSSGIGDHMNNYTLVLMIIFFLQKRGILHPLEVLQQGVEREEVEGWNFAFSRDISNLPQLRSYPSSTSNLLLQFFKFYVNFSYDNVICPMLGQKVKKQTMKQGIGIPEVLDGSPSFGREGEKLELDKALVVQDPFELTRNVGHAVSRQRLDHMLAEFSTAVRLLQDLRVGEVQKVEFWMLLEPGMVSYKGILSQEFDDSQSLVLLDIKNELRVGKYPPVTEKLSEELSDDHALHSTRNAVDQISKEHDEAMNEETLECTTKRDSMALQEMSSSTLCEPSPSIKYSMKSAKQFLFQQQSLRFPSVKLPNHR